MQTPVLASMAVTHVVSGVQFLMPGWCTGHMTRTKISSGFRAFTIPFCNRGRATCVCGLWLLCSRDLRPQALTGSKMEKICDKVHITLNKNAVQVGCNSKCTSDADFACVDDLNDWSLEKSASLIGMRRILVGVKLKCDVARCLMFIEMIEFVRTRLSRCGDYRNDVPEIPFFIAVDEQKWNIEGHPAPLTRPRQENGGCLSRC